ncbi:MAG: sugar transferase [Flammeovirgaceae bacterium]|nr:MAG: sugar transferase [Flammeovirgaceae bacterium]
MYVIFVKPFFDKIAALIILLITSPVMLVVISALAIANKGKVWFVQERPGKDERIFKLIKFKTMHDAVDASGVPLPDEYRLTSLGKWVRKTSIDELPQLVNVLLGDMSIVGPRPLLTEYLPLYNASQRRRHKVKPGITGWAQVHGRNRVVWPDRFNYDVWYVDHQSFWLDLKILAMTIIKVLKSEGIGSGTSDTMEKFKGNN